MTRVRVSAALGALALLAACAMPWIPLANSFATGLPYQDATPEMLQEQAAAAAAAERLLLLSLLVALALAVAGLALLVYAVRLYQKSRTS